MEIEVDTPNVDDTEKRETTPEGDTKQINTGSGNRIELLKEDVFEKPRDGSTKSKSTKIHVLNIAAQQKRDSLLEAAEKSECT